MASTKKLKYTDSSDSSINQPFLAAISNLFKEFPRDLELTQNQEETSPSDEQPLHALLG